MIPSSEPPNSLQKQFEKMNQEAEKLLLEGGSRNADSLSGQCTFALHQQAISLLNNQDTRSCVAILTGFPIVLENEEVRYENDGPIGAVLLAGALVTLGINVILLAPIGCQSIMGAMIETEDSLCDRNCLFPLPTKKPLRDLLTKANTRHLISIEHPGVSKDGHYYNMRGKDISSNVIAMDHLFTDTPWTTSAFADGGNEIGCGCIDGSLISENIEHGEVIFSTTEVDHLTLCGVSNWGAFGLISYLSVASKHGDLLMNKSLTPLAHSRLFWAADKAGAVDGVTCSQTGSVDGIPLAEHNAKISAFFELANKYLI